MAVNKVVYGNTPLIDLTGDTATPADVASGKLFHDKAGVQQTGSGTIVTPTIITPSNSSPASMSNGGIYKASGNGYAVASSPISLAPSNSSPPSITDNEIYKTSGNGYAIQSYGNVTPSADGTYFASGFRKMSSSGYAYSSRPSEPSFNVFYNANQGLNSFTISNLTVGKKYLMLVFADTGSTYANNRYDNITVSSASKTKLTNFFTSGSHHSAGTFFQIVPNSTSITVSDSNAFSVIIFNV